MHRVTEDLAPQRWDAYVEASAAGTPYHRWVWRGIIEKSFGHRCHYLAALDAQDRVTGVLPLVHMKSALFGNFLVSVPFVNYGGVLCDSEAAREALLARADALRGECGASYVELRHVGHAHPGLPERRHKVTMLLALERDPKAQWDGFDAKLRNQVRKAEKVGLSCLIGDAEYLDDFYRVFARNMRDLGTPVYAKRFFQSVLADLAGSARIVAVKRGETVIAAGILSRYRDSVEMPWASSLAEYRTLCPNNMMYWEAIKYAIGLGCTSFDFGRSTPDGGTYNFKKQWGAKPVQLHWQYLLDQGTQPPELDNKNPRYRMAIALWRRLPVLVTRLAGPHIVRCIP
ncbi:FemAB family PEP-CTERM system-associated protein [Geomonas subterranea]|uniref:FemAB family PEP-CTERM system-associated protein n=1 Tax=Geomonas subterranea TaxID=2847989 RepID=A0ABX8LIV8_9BACT|nr:FemAB family XrtA/PEP-CTERM system-associated protein [Geomonas subterranea]QXE91663.1 FemAB family PEP-CTERM system-associated protein [Geomonas subterranea]QXM10243.1 FemAB family PEP-CTERM system-associated protein [Geomonas subterranea]